MNKNRVTPTEVGVVGVCTDFSCNNCKKKSNKRLLKIFAAGGLAFFMGVGTLCGVVLAPMGATSASNAGDLAALAQSAARALSPQEQLLAGTLEFDSENDPVIYTTDYGLDIRWHLTGYKEDPSTLDKIPSGKFSGYAYIEAAGVKWAIIGYSSTITNRLQSGKINLANILATYSSFSGYTIESIWSLLQKQEVDSTDAGAEIYDVYKTVDSDVYNSSAVSATYIDPSALFPNAIEIELTEDSELQADEVLCFAQGRIDGTSGVAFKTGNGNFVQTEYANYQGSILEEYLETWYNTNLKSTLSPYIISKTLYTLHYKSSSTVTTKLFPLAGINSSESFYYDTYLNEGKNGNMDIDVYWWLRSGDTGTSTWIRMVNHEGIIASYTRTEPLAVRPAFVLKI